MNNFLGFMIIVLIGGGIPLLISEVFGVSKGIAIWIFIGLMIMGGWYLGSKGISFPKEKQDGT